jgi:hypothetical protein
MMRAISGLVHPTLFYPFSSWMICLPHERLVGKTILKYIFLTHWMIACIEATNNTLLSNIYWSRAGETLFANEDLRWESIDAGGLASRAR